jgi:hypothetical protein
MTRHRAILARAKRVAEWAERTGPRHAYHVGSSALIFISHDAKARASYEVMM